MAKLDVQGWTWEAASQAARSAQSRMLRDVWSRVYLYHKRGSVTTRTADQAPDGYNLTCAEAFPINMTIEQLTRWAYDHLRTAACLPMED